MEKIMNEAEQAIKTVIQDTRDLNKSVTIAKKVAMKKESLQSKKKEKIEEINGKYDPMIRELTEVMEKIKKTIFSYVMANRDEIFAYGTKTAQLTSGKVGIKNQRPHLELEEGQTWDKVLEQLKEQNRQDLMRVKYEVDKITMLNRSQEEEIRELLRQLRIIIATGEECFLDFKN